MGGFSWFVHPNMLCCEQLFHRESTGFETGFAQHFRSSLTFASRIGAACRSGAPRGGAEAIENGPVSRRSIEGAAPGLSRFPCRIQCRTFSVPWSKPQAKYWPPLALMVEPVMKPASSEARKTTQRAISSGSPRRPTGICGMMRSLSTFSSIALTISVAM